jgi:hypothetical protein
MTGMSNIDIFQGLTEVFSGPGLASCGVGLAAVAALAGVKLVQDRDRIAASIRTNSAARKSATAQARVLTAQSATTGTQRRKQQGQGKTVNASGQVVSGGAFASQQRPEAAAPLAPVQQQPIWTAPKTR